MNPVPVMKLVEVISGIATSQATLDTTLALAAKMGKGAMRASYFPR
jgi:3-hydroxybutyryl-CoA dehydrogenase